jgi:FHS family Na+ dependent glucose MFS transporter 1
LKFLQIKPGCAQLKIMQQDVSVELQDDEVQTQQVTTTKYNELPLYKHPDFRHNMRNTLVFCWAFAMSGIALTITGPTLPQLARNVGASVDQMGWIFTGKAITSIVCNAGAGRIMDHFKDSPESKKLLINKIMLVIAPLTISLSMCLVPFIPYLWLMIIVNAICEIGTSITNLVASVLMVWIWKDRVNGPVQLLHFSFGVGGVISPLIVSATNAIVTKISGPGDIIPEETDRVVYNKYTHVATAYVFSGILCLSSIPLIVFVLQSNKAATSTEATVQEIELEGTDSQQEEPKEEDKKAKRKNIIVSLLIGLALLNYVGAELGYGAVIYSYVVEMTKMASETEGSMLTSAFWLSFTIGRLLGVPTSAVLSPKNMILLDIAGGMASVTAILIFNSNMTALWICTIAFGLSLASQYPTTISLPASHMGLEVTGTMTATMVIFASFGGMIVPLFMTMATKWAGPQAFIYVLFGTCLVASLFYLILIFGFKKTEKQIVKEEKQFESPTEDVELSTIAEENSETI